jgi:predicted MFS family arabinose efflux permease
MLALFVAHEASTSQPAVQLDLFRSARFSAALYCSLAFGAASAILFILPPFLLETQLGLRPWQVGLVAAIAPVGLVAASRWSGKRIEALGAQRLMTLGLALMLGALALLAITHRTVSPALIGPLLLVYGVGGGLFQPANIATVMAAESSDRQGTIGAVQRMAQNVGIALGATVGGAFLTAAEGQTAGGQLGAAAGAWLSAAALVAVGLGAFVALARRRNTHAQLESQ